MAKSVAERQKEFRERQKLYSQKQSITFLLDADVIAVVTSNAKQQGFNQSDYVNKALKDVTSNDALQAEIAKLTAELAKVKESKPTPISYGASFADKKAIAELKVKIAELEANETILVAAVRKKLSKLSPAELAAINEKLKCFG